MATLLWQNQNRTCNPTVEWMPRTDVLETEQGFQLKLDVPGITREEVDIQVANDTMTIKGTRKRDSGPEAYHRLERPYGSFSRAFLLPDAVNQSAIEAKLADGVLNLFLPRREESKPKQVQVKVQ